MRRVIATLLLGLALLVVVLYLMSVFHLLLADALGVIGLLSVAAALVAFWPGRKARPRCELLEAWLQSSHAEFAANNQLWEFKLSARLSNFGDDTDTLVDVLVHLSKGGETLHDKSLTTGARLIDSRTGHVLPFPLAPQAVVVAEGVGNLSMSVSRMLELAEDRSTPWVGVFTFKFLKSPAQQVTLSSDEPHWEKPSTGV